jgi:hypothetical protein
MGRHKESYRQSALFASDSLVALVLFILGCLCLAAPAKPWRGSSWLLALTQRHFVSIRTSIGIRRRGGLYPVHLRSWSPDPRTIPALMLLHRGCDGKEQVLGGRIGAQEPAISGSSCPSISQRLVEHSYIQFREARSHGGSVQNINHHHAIQRRGRETMHACSVRLGETTNLRSMIHLEDKQNGYLHAASSPSD